MSRVILLLGLATGVLFFNPSPGQAHYFWRCSGRAFDTTTDIIPGLNYTWFAAFACCTLTGTANMDALDAVGHLQEIDWATHEWRDVPDVDEVRATELDDDSVVAYGALSIAPFGGINCRRIRVYFIAVDSHPGGSYALQSQTTHSQGECY